MTALDGGRRKKSKCWSFFFASTATASHHRLNRQKRKKKMIRFFMQMSLQTAYTLKWKWHIQQENGRTGITPEGYKTGTAWNTDFFSSAPACLPRGHGCAGSSGFSRWQKLLVQWVQGYTASKKDLMQTTMERKFHFTIVLAILPLPSPPFLHPIPSNPRGSEFGGIPFLFHHGVEDLQYIVSWLVKKQPAEKQLKATKFRSLLLFLCNDFAVFFFFLSSTTTVTTCSCGLFYFH